jgi:hypothetical protein
MLDAPREGRTDGRLSPKPSSAFPPCCRFRFSSGRSPRQGGRGQQRPRPSLAHVRLGWSVRGGGHVAGDGYCRAPCTGSLDWSADHRPSIRKSLNVARHRWGTGGGTRGDLPSRSASCQPQGKGSALDGRPWRTRRETCSRASPTGRSSCGQEKSSVRCPALRFRAAQGFLT